MSVRLTFLEMSCSNERMAGLGEILCARQDPSCFLWKQFAEEKQWDKGTNKSILEVFPWRDESDGKRMAIKAVRINHR